MTNRVLLGPLGGGSFGLKVSRPGYDVLGSIADEQLAFDSRWIGAMRLKASGSFTGTGSSQVVMFGVTLAAPPLLFLYYKQSGAYWSQSYNSFSGVPSNLVGTDRVTLTGGSGLVYTWFAFLP
jgi:hypothetical protein